MKKLITSSKGLTLVELLAASTLISIITIIILNYILSGMESYDKTSGEVSLHNNANVVMTRFTNEIYEAKDVTVLESPSIIQLKKQNTVEPIYLSFKNNGAFIQYGSNEAISLSTSNFSGSSFIVNDEQNTVTINMVVNYKEAGSKLKLINEISWSGYIEKEVDKE